MPVKVRFTDKQILSALNRHRGKVFLAAKSIGCHRDTIYTRAKKVPEVQEAIDQPRGELVDTAELALEQAVIRGEAWAVCFTLKTQGKDRGYVERSEHTGKDGASLTRVIEDDGWYGNQAHDRAAESAAASGASAPGRSEK